MDYHLLQITLCPIYSLLLILCFPIAIQTEAITTLLSHKTLSGECSPFSLRHLWSCNILAGAFQCEHTVASPAHCCAYRCQSSRVLWHVLIDPLMPVFCWVGLKIVLCFARVGLTPYTKACHIIWGTTGRN